MCGRLALLATPALFAVESLTITNTTGNHNSYGLYGDGIGSGTIALAQLTRSYVWTHNVLAGGQGAGVSYPATTWKPSSAEHQAQFVPLYQLAPAS